MALHVYQDLLGYIKTTGDAYLGTSIAAVANAIEPFAYGALSLLVLIWAVDCLIGTIDSPLRDAVRRFIKITIIFSIGIKLGQYNVYITNFFLNTPGEIAALLTGSSSSSDIMKTLDTTAFKGYLLGKEFWDNGGIVGGDFGMYLLALIVWGITIGVTGYSCFLISMAMILLYLIISIGAIFILSLMFKATENFFSSWIAQLSNYSILILLVYMINTFVMTLFTRVLTDTSKPGHEAAVDQIFPFIIMGIVLLLTLKQLPNPAAGLAGGIGVASEGAGRMAMGLLSSSAKHTLRPVGRGAAWAGKKAGRRAWSAAKNMRSNSISKP